MTARAPDRLAFPYLLAAAHTPEPRQPGIPQARNRRVAGACTQVPAACRIGAGQTEQAARPERRAIGAVENKNVALCRAGGLAHVMLHVRANEGPLSDAARRRRRSVVIAFGSVRVLLRRISHRRLGAVI